jgi:hypothetical protein
MKTDDRRLDTLIREAMSREDAELFDRIGEPSLPDLLTESFRGRLRWLNLFGFVLTFACFGLAAFCAVMVLRADEATTMLRWGLGFAFGLVSLSALKLWFWLELQRHALTREIKRVELAVAHLAGELRSRAAGPAR